MNRFTENQPVKFSARTLSALTILAGAFPLVARAFGWIDWGVEQSDAYFIAVNAILGAGGIMLGVAVAKVVTPTANPRDDAGNVLTPGPIGDDNPDTLPTI